MKPTQKKSSCNSASGQIGSRPYFAERDGISCGKLGFGEPGWARATTHFKRPECAGPVARIRNPIRKLSEVKPVPASSGIDTTGKGETVSVPSGKFDESAYFVKTAKTTQAIQNKLEKAYKAAKLRGKRQIALNPTERPKETILGLKDIPVNPDFKLRMPEFLSREEVRTDDGGSVPRCKVERVEKVVWIPPSNGGRAGRVERWGA